MTVIEIISMAGPSLQQTIRSELDVAMRHGGKEAARKVRMTWARFIADQKGIAHSSIKDLDKGPPLQHIRRTAMKYKKGAR